MNQTKIQNCWIYNNNNNNNNIIIIIIIIIIINFLYVLYCKYKLAKNSMQTTFNSLKK